MGRVGFIGVGIMGKPMARNLIKAADLGLKVFYSDAIETVLPDLEESVEKSERTRLQLDVVYKF